jgi:phospholipid N-methyltransferase
MRYWTECREFFGQFRRHYFTTGSILPSSRGLGRALASPMRRDGGPPDPPRRILEVGPGTGAVTCEILRQLTPGDRVDIVEINEHFVDLLKRRFNEDGLFCSKREQVSIIHAPLQELAGEGIYDYMISGLPLNNFPLALVREIFRAYERLLKPEGVLSYFEYLWIRSAKRLFVSRPERRRLHVLSRFLERRIQAYQFREDWVFLNIPPAVARHLRFRAAPPGHDRPAKVARQPTTGISTSRDVDTN